MTLALYGKSRRRQQALLFIGLMAIIVAALAGAAMLNSHGAKAIEGAIYTTLPDGNTVNQNTYANKADVYLNGGPNNPTQCNGGAITSGLYYYQVVQTAGGGVLLSTDAIQNREVEVTGGVFAGNGGTGNHLEATAASACGSVGVQLLPFNDSSNGEYKVLVYEAACIEAGTTAEQRASTTPLDLDTVKDATGKSCESKSDNFKVGETPTPTNTPVTPTSTPVTPTSTPVTPTSTPVTPTSTPVTPTSTPVTPTSTPVTPTSTPVTPTSTPVTPTSTPVTPTSTPVTPTATPTGTVSPTGDLRIEKYLDINGDGDAADVALGEGPIASWNMTVNGPDENGVFPTGAGGFVSFSGLTSGDSYTITEALPAGWVLTNVKVDGGNSAVTVTKLVTIPDGGTRVVAYYNQPLGSLNVHKVAVTSHNGGPDVAAPGDDDGWTITVVSAACGINQSKQTDASGNASFTGLPLCSDYVVSENTSNADSPGFVPVGAPSASNVTPGGQTITFTNRRATIDPVCVDCIPIIPTPTNTPVPPTATPTNTPVPPTNTPSPTPVEETAGEKTPGPTPIPPSTGTGTGSGGSANINFLLIVAGLAVLSGGMSLAAAGQRRRK